MRPSYSGRKTRRNVTADWLFREKLLEGFLPLWIGEDEKFFELVDDDEQTAVAEALGRAA